MRATPIFLGCIDSVLGLDINHMVPVNVSFDLLFSFNKNKIRFGKLMFSAFHRCQFPPLFLCLLMTGNNFGTRFFKLVQFVPKPFVALYIIK